MTRISIDVDSWAIVIYEASPGSAWYFAELENPYGAPIQGSGTGADSAMFSLLAAIPDTMEMPFEVRKELVTQGTEAMTRKLRLRMTTFRV